MSESNIWEKRVVRAQHPNVKKEWETYDLMKWYRESINEVETEEIMAEVHAGMKGESEEPGKTSHQPS